MSPYLSTYDLANELKVKPQTIRSAFCKDGHYLGIKPLKLLNRRLLWPAESLNSLINAKTKSGYQNHSEVTNDE